MGVGIGDRYVYSLWPTGVNTTDTASFNAALSAMDRGELVIRDNGKKLVLDGAVATPSALTKPVRIRGESPNVTVKLNNAFQVIWGIDDNPATSGTPAAFSGLNAGETKFQSPSLSLAQGDWVLLLADDTLTGVDGHIVSGVQHPAELHRVEYVSGSDIFLDMPVCDTYSVNPRVMKITMIPNCGLVDLQLESDTQYAPGTSTQQWNWKVNNTIDFRFDNVRCLEDGPGYIAIYKSARAQFLNFSGLHQATNYWDYGLVVGPCRDTLFADSSWSGSRHVVSTTGWDDGTDRWGTPRNTIIRNVTARVPDDNVATQWVTFDCHAEGYETLFDSCKCYIGTQQQGYAFSSRARKTIYKDCHVIGGNDDNVAKNNSHYGIRFLAEGCSVIGCRIENVWQGVNQRTGSQGTNYGGFSVIDTEFIDCSSVGIRQSTTGNGAYIKGNRFKNSGTYYNIVSPFIPKAFICIEGGTGHIIRQNDLSKDGNDYSIWVNTLSETDFDIRGNVFEGYGDGKLGIADGANSGTLAVNYDFDGAFSRYNVTDKSYDVINVMEYGAVGDGVTDETAAFSAAIATGSNVLMPSGDYVISAGLTLNANQRLIGSGKRSTTLSIAEDGLGAAVITMADGAEVHDFQIVETNANPQKTTVTNSDIGIKNGTASNTLCKNVYVKGLKYPFDADDSTGVADHVRYEDCEASHCYGWGFHVDGTSRVNYTRCLAWNCGVDGFKAGNDSGFLNKSLTYDHCVSHTNGRRDQSVGGLDSPFNGNAFDVYHGGYRTTLVGCKGWGNIGSGFVAKGSDAGQQCGELSLVACEFYDNLTNYAGSESHGIEINNSDGTLGNRTSIIGCICHGNSGEGIAIQGGNGIHILGGSFCDNDRVGVRVTGAGSDVSINGASINGNWDGNVIIGDTDDSSWVSRGVSIRDSDLWGTYSPWQATGETPEDLNVDSFTFTADAGTNVITATGHTYSDGDRVNVSSTTTLPGGLSAKTWYYVISSASNVFKLSQTYGGSEIDITTTGTGTHTVKGKGSAVGVRIYSDSADVTIDGCTVGNIDGSNGAIRTEGKRVRIKNGRVYNQTRTAIYIEGGEAFVTNNLISNTDVSTDVSWGALRINGACDAIDNEFINASLTSNSRGVRYQSGSSGRHRGNKSTNYTTTVSIAGGTVFSDSISSGSGSPSGSVTPDGIGHAYFDTSGTAWYKSTGLTNTDWQAL